MSIIQAVRPLINQQVYRKFFSNLGIVFVFRFITAVLSMVAIILTVRSCGVTAMGNITLIQNTANFLIIPIICGINSSIIRYLPAYEEKSEEFIGSALIGNLVIAVVFVLLYVILRGAFIKITNLSSQQWVHSVLMAVAINFATVFESVLRAKKSFFSLGTIKLVSTLIFFTIIVLSGLTLKNYSIYIIGFIINQVIFAAFALRKMGLKRIRFSLGIIKKVYEYGSINMVSWILSYIIFSIDLFIINHYCSTYEVGIFSLYQTNVRNIFNILFHDIFAVVFLPTIVCMDKVKIYKKIVSIIPLLLPCAILANIAIGITMFYLYGHNYRFNMMYVIIVALSTAFHFIYWIFNSVFTIEGKKGALLCLTVLGIPMPLLIAANILFVKYYGIAGSMICSIITQLVLIAAFIIFIKNRFLKGDQKTTDGVKE
jgi:O-antigen/teichoic acid export membrane protein